MKPIKGPKRLALGLAAVVGLAIGVLAAIPMFIHPDAVRDAVRAEIRAATGLEPVLRGEVAVSLFPSGSVRFSDVVLSGNGGGRPALAAERLTGQLSFLPLLLGRIEVADITLVKPQILVHFDKSGTSNWAGLVSRLAPASAGGGADKPMSFSEIRLIGGTLLLHDESRDVDETLDRIEVSLAWPSISKSFGATGQFSWRGEQVDASLTVADFMAALSGERTGVKLRLNAVPLKLAFDGHAAQKPTMKLEGALAADTTSLRRAMAWIGQDPLPSGGFGRFALKAQTHMIGGTVLFSKVNVELDGNAAEGVLTLGTEARPQVQGTLAAEAIDLTPYTSAMRLVGSDGRGWSRAPILLQGLSGLDFDMRLSAARIVIGNTKLGRTALTTTVRNGRFTLGIAESQAFGGMLKGALALSKTDAGADLKAQLQFADVDLDASTTALFGARRLEGRGHATFAIEAAGPDMLSLARSANGTGHVSAVGGAVAGVNVEQLLRRLERRPLSGAGDFRSGRTPFDRLAIAIKVTDGTAELEDVKLEGPSVRVAMGGSASIPARDFDLKGTAALVSSSTAFELPFVVRGGWDDPIMLPDVQSLIRRSGAAAPLLDAVRGGRTRESVKSALDALIRGKDSTDATAPPAPEAAPAQ